MPEPTWVEVGKDGFSGPALSTVHDRAFDDASGRRWEVVVGAALVEGGRARITSPVSTRTVARLAMGLFAERADGRVKVSIPAGSNRISVFGRMNAASSTGYVAHFDTEWVYLYRLSAGTSNYMGRVFVGTLLPAPVFMLEVVGDKIRVRTGLGGLLLEVTNGAIAGPGYWGFEISSAGQYVTEMAFSFDEDSVTEAPTTDAPTTGEPETDAPTTAEPETDAPTTPDEPTFAPTTDAPTTEAPTTTEPETDAPTTAGPTTPEPETDEPVLGSSGIRAIVSYVEERDRLVCRAWVVDDSGRTRSERPDVAACELRVIGEDGTFRLAIAAADPEEGVVRFVLPQARFMSGRLYLARLMLDDVGPSTFGLPVG